MNANSESPAADSRREVDRWLGNYSEDHRNSTNILIHWICVPLILWTAIALLWVVPVPALLGRPGLWAGVAMFFALSFYLRLSRPLGFGMLVAFVVLGVITEMLYRVLGATALLWLAIAIFVTAWIAQFIVAKIMRRLGIAY